MTWRVRDPSDLIPALAFLGQAHPPYIVTFKAGEENRRDQQNRFAFEAYSQIAAILGDRTPNDVRAETKLCVGIPIMRQDDDFRSKYDEMIRPLPYQTKLAMMVEPFDFAVTRLMTVRQMTDYISQMLAYWDAQGASVMMPDFDR
jgi:hypothetical protein